MTLTPIVTEYTVAAFQRDDRNGHHWRIQVRRSPDGWWAIHHDGMWLQPDRTWRPDRRGALIFGDEGNAVVVAQTALRNLDVNGTTWDDMVQRWGEPS